MTSDEFAEALSRLVSEAEDAGLDREAILAELEGMAEGMRLSLKENGQCRWSEGGSLTARQAMQLRGWR